MIKYITNIFKGIWALMQGMYVAMKNMIRPKVTEKYPENRGKKEYFDRMRGQLIMPHDQNNQHKCTACLICMNSCPNGTIKITTRMEADPETGKERKVLDKYSYDIGSCIFCGLCTKSCPQDAICWSNNFEHSVFNRNVLFEQLNHEGSSLKKKPAAEKPTPAPAIEKPTTPVVTAASEPTSAVSEPTSAASEPTSAVSEPTSAASEPTSAVQMPSNPVAEATTTSANE